MGFPGSTVVKKSPANVGDAREGCLVPGLGRSPGVENGNPIKYSCLENPRDRGTCQATVHGVTKSWTQLSDIGIFSPYTSLDSYSQNWFYL